MQSPAKSTEPRRSKQFDICPFVVAIDTREQRPFEFRGILGDADTRNRPIKIETVRMTIPAGDYSIRGFEHHYAIERKSLPDLFQSLGAGHDREEAKIARLNSLKAAAYVIEGDWHEILTKPPRESKVNPKTIIRTIAAWSVRYERVQWFPMPSRRIAEIWTFRLLQRVWIESERQQKQATSGAA